MQTPAQKFWDIRLQSCKEALENNNFEAFVAPTPADAAKIVRDQILPQLDVKSVSWGDSKTLYESGILEFFMDCSSPARICNVWTIHEKSYPKGRIKVILINQDLGL